MRKQFYISVKKPIYTLRFNCQGYDMYMGGGIHEFTVVAHVETLNWKELIYKRVDHRELLTLVPSNIEITDHYLRSITDQIGRVIWETARPLKKQNEFIQTIIEYASLFTSPFLFLAIEIQYIWKKIKG